MYVQNFCQDFEAKFKNFIRRVFFTIKLGLIEKVNLAPSVVQNIW